MLETKTVNFLFLVSIYVCVISFKNGYSWLV